MLFCLYEYIDQLVHGLIMEVDILIIPVSYTHLVKCLQAENVTITFGYPGAVICPFYDFLEKTEIEHVLVRSEQNGAHEASGFARASGKAGVCIATSGPGATNLLSLIHI